MAYVLLTTLVKKRKTNLYNYDCARAYSALMATARVNREANAAPFNIAIGSLLTGLVTTTNYQQQKNTQARVLRNFED